MDIGACFSPLEFNEVLDIHFIGYYGFTTRAVFSKLKELETEEAAFDYLTGYRNRLIIINKELNSYYKNPDLKINKVKNPVAQSILEDFEANKHDFSLFESLDQLNPFIFWIENLVRKFGIINDFAEMEESVEILNKSTPKITWMGNKGDFVALFDKLFDSKLFAYEKNKYQLLSKHFTWYDEEIDSKKLKHLKNNMLNKSETHKYGDKLKSLRFE